jgi:hypothetical protein
MFAWLVPSIEKHSGALVLCCTAVFGIGVGRGLSLLHYVHVPENSLGAMVAEFALPPFLVL